MVRVTVCPGRLGSVQMSHEIVWPCVAFSGVRDAIRVCVSEVGVKVAAAATVLTEETANARTRKIAQYTVMVLFLVFNIFP